MELADRRNCTAWCTYYWSVEYTFAANIILSFSQIRGKIVCALISVLPLYHFYGLGCELGISSVGGSISSSVLSGKKVY